MTRFGEDKIVISFVLLSGYPRIGARREKQMENTHFILKYFSTFVPSREISVQLI